MLCIMSDGKWQDYIRERKAYRASKPTLRPVPGSNGDLWSCGYPGQVRHVGLTPEAAYRSWSRMK
jgi:hypothetical protein